MKSFRAYQKPSYRRSAQRKFVLTAKLLSVSVTLALMVLASLCVAETPNSEPSANRPLTLSRADREKLVFVQDFELDTSNFKEDKGGITGKGSILPPRLLACPDFAGNLRMPRRRRN